MNPRSGRPFYLHSYFGMGLAQAIRCVGHVVVVVDVVGAGHQSDDVGPRSVVNRFYDG